MPNGAPRSTRPSGRKRLNVDLEGKNRPEEHAAAERDRVRAWRIRTGRVAADHEWRD